MTCFPFIRPRHLRQIVSQIKVSIDHLALPLFIAEDIKKPVPSALISSYY